jgi:hypothetical protein
MKENREKLINLIGEYFTDEQVDYLYKVLRVFTSGYLAKKDLCDLSDLADHNAFL